MSDPSRYRGCVIVGRTEPPNAHGRQPTTGGRGGRFVSDDAGILIVRPTPPRGWGGVPVSLWGVQMWGRDAVVKRAGC